MKYKKHPRKDFTHNYSTIESAVIALSYSNDTITSAYTTGLDKEYLAPFIKKNKITPNEDSSLQLEATYWELIRNAIC